LALLSSRTDLSRISQTKPGPNIEVAVARNWVRRVGREEKEVEMWERRVGEGGVGWGDWV